MPALAARSSDGAIIAGSVTTASVRAPEVKLRVTAVGDLRPDVV